VAIAFARGGQEGRQTGIAEGGKQSRLAGQPGERLCSIGIGQAGGIQFLERHAHPVITHIHRLVDGAHPRAVGNLLDAEAPSDQRTARQRGTGGVGGELR